MKSFRIKKSKEQLEQAQIQEKMYLENIQDFFSQLSTSKTELEIISEASKLIAEETLDETEEVYSELTPIVEPITPPSVVDVVAKSIKESVFEIPDTPRLPKDVEILSKKVTDLQNWITKIAMTGPGSGEVNLRWLDDIDRSTIFDGRWLKYSAANKKFVFDEIANAGVIYTTSLVNTSTYTINDTDYYIGVNYAGPTTITLPLTPLSGRRLIVKDESGIASTNPILLVGNIDNDPSGATIQIDNGALQLIYRDGWRIS